MNFIKKISSTLTKKTKNFFLFIVVLSFFKTLIELLSMGLSIPILKILSNLDKKNEIYIKFPYNFVNYYLKLKNNKYYDFN